MRSVVLASVTALFVFVSVQAATAAPIPLSGTLDLGTADPSAVGKLDGVEPGAFAGESVASIGDFNGDGRTDSLVGERGMDAGGPDAGGAWVVLGTGAPGSLKLGDPGTIRIDGASQFDSAGLSVAAAGDVNEDGLADVVIGAPNAQPGTENTFSPTTGVAYVVFGRRDGGPIRLTGDFGGYRIDGVGDGDQAGFRVGSIGDVNGDKRPEILVGAPSADPRGRKDAGSGYLVYGKSSPDTVKLGALGDDKAGLTLDGPAAAGAIDGGENGRGGATAGRAINSVGDLNGDGRPEILIGAPRAGSDQPGQSAGIAYVVWGRDDPARLDLGDLGGAGYAITGSLSPKASTADQAGAKEGDLIGAELDPAGDVNGDGLPDIVVTGYLSDSSDRLNVGVGWVVFGKAGAESVNLDAVSNGAGGFRITGIDAQDQTGFAASTAGDFNADGLADVAVATRLAEPLARADAGVTYVIWGSREPKDLDLAEFGTQALRIIGAAPGDSVGHSVAPAGDVNGDGGADLLIGAPRTRSSEGERQSGAPTTTEPGSEVKPGSAYVVYGAASAAEGRPTEPSAMDPGYLEELQAGCRPVANVQALIIDDDYIDDLDPDRLRRQALDLYVERPRNYGTVIGLTGFPDTAPEPVLKPFSIGLPTDVKPLKVLADEIKGDDGFPGWEGMLRSAPIDNPGAQARIYLMDGVGFGEVARLEGLTEGAPPSYVIAVGTKFRRKDAKVMQALAKQTKGKYYAVRNSSGIQKAVGAIESRLRCDVDRTQAEAVLRDEGSDDVNVVGVDDDAYSVDVMISWAGDYRDQYEIEDLDVMRGNRVVDSYDEDELDDVYALDDFDDIYGDEPAAFSAGSASAAQAPGKRLVGNRGRGFRNVRVRGLRKGLKLRIRVTADRLRGKGGRVVTQVQQSRRRR